MAITKQLAKEGELRFAAELTREGWEIFFPYGEDSPIDILAHKKGKIMKIQIKTTKEKEGAIICKLRSTNNWQNKKYNKKNVDVFGFYNYQTKKGYLVPFKETQDKSEIKLRVSPTKNKQKKNIRDARKYLFFE